jgi:hypothetical protein
VTAERSGGVAAEDRSWSVWLLSRTDSWAVLVHRARRGLARRAVVVTLMVGLGLSAGAAVQQIAGSLAIASEPFLDVARTMLLTALGPGVAS